MTDSGEDRVLAYMELDFYWIHPYDKHYMTDIIGMMSYDIYCHF